MSKFLRNIFLALMFLASVPAVTYASEAVEIIEQDNQGITITVQDNVLHVTNANGQMLFIYNVTGVRVMSIKIEGADKRVELNLPKGCYIVKVGNTVRKISLK
ncbi:MAG: T9SS type A sorting domain-containing protein [Prevotella sp.]|nr:T9SS type A sorting domain-containing protein [Prevotella sp.]MBR1462671.1 T9SS type A sorting domain-containing protein [Prevotella sp.]